MHREIVHTDSLFEPERPVTHYVLTAFFALLLGLDLWPTVVGWSGLGLPNWSATLFGIRFVWIAAVLGCARTVAGCVDGWLDGRVGADLALAIASLAAICLREPYVAAEIVVIGMIGECLESFTFGRTQRALRKLVEVFPRRCWVLRDGQEVRVLTDALRVGDQIVVKPGGKVPVDGVVLAGESTVDQSALTGESLPCDVGPGATVLAGSINQLGALTIEARLVAESTVAGRVIELTAAALKQKAPLERTADRLARLFLPTVLAVAVVTVLISFVGYTRLGSPAAFRQSIYPGLTVLVVACPCALILATPAAVIAALGRLAGTGILLKGGVSLERLAGVRAFAFDKTGTLTEGRLELGDVVPLAKIDAAEILRIAATAEQGSEHLLAQLLVQAARRQQLSPGVVTAFQAYPGAGVTASTADGAITVGTQRFLGGQGITLPAAATAAVDRLETAGQTTLIVARDGVVLGVLGARDRVRPEAAGVIAELRSLGITEIALLTGDNATVAHTVAEAVAIHTVHTGLLPAQKAEVIATLGSVAMVGDGINDAPALARATVGLAMANSGVDAAAEAGDIVLLNPSLTPLPLLLRLARATVGVIRQNILVFAFGVNAVGIILTAWLWPVLFPRWAEHGPLAGVIYHQIGSLAVLLNSARLLWFERRPVVPVLNQTRAVVRAVDQWVATHVRLDDLWHWVEHHWRLAVAVLAVFLLSGYLGSGLTQVGPDEIAVVRRFGRPLDDDLGPGLWWRWPWPIEEGTRVQPDRIRTIEVGYRPLLPNGPATLAWASPHGGDIRRLGDESLMLTGDGNLIEVQAAVRYHLDRGDVRRYLFTVHNPEEILRATAETALREGVAGLPFADLLTVHRADFQRAVLTRLNERCRGIGVQVDGLSLVDAHPPAEVVPAYHDVIRAMEARDRRLNESRADALRTVRSAETTALEIVRRAKSAARARTLLADAESVAFEFRRSARAAPDFIAEWLLFTRGVSAVAHGQPPVTALRDYATRRGGEHDQWPVVSDVRRFWDSIAPALAGRDKIIIDADKVPGKRHLWLFDPEPLRSVLPVGPAAEKAGANEKP